MGARFSKADYRQEHGFTLIELVVVIIIIVILAMIAIPLYISQRQKGWDANVKSDLHNASVAEQTYYHDNDAFTANVSDLTYSGYRKSSKISISVVSADSTGFCIEAYHESRPSQNWFVDNGSGSPNPQVGDCS